MANHSGLIVIALCVLQYNVLILAMHRPDDENFLRNGNVQISAKKLDQATQQFYHTTPISPPTNHLLPPPESTEPTSPTCARNSFGRFPIPNDCNKYLRCWNGHPEIITCQLGKMFNKNTKLCERPENVQCANQIQEPSPLIGEHISRQSASRMIDFRNPPQPTPENQVEELEVHEFGNMQCQSSSGLEPHPDYCNKFLNCVNGNGYVQECGPGTVFNEALQVCDWPYNVDCSRNGGTVHDGEFSLDIRSDRSDSADAQDEFQVRPTISAARLNAIRNYALEVKPLRRGKDFGTNSSQRRIDTAPGYDEDEGQEKLSVGQSQNRYRQQAQGRNGQHRGQRIPSATPGTAPEYDAAEGQEPLYFGQSQITHNQRGGAENIDFGQETVSFREHGRRQGNYAPIVRQPTTTEASLNENHQPISGHYVHQTIQSNTFDNQMTSSQRYNQHRQTSQTSEFDNQLASSQSHNKYMRKITTPISVTSTPSSTTTNIPTISRFDQEYQIGLEERIRSRNTDKEVKSTTTVPTPSLYFVSPVDDELQVASSDQWGFHTITETQRLPYTADQRHNSNRGAHNFASNHPNTLNFVDHSQNNNKDDTQQISRRVDDGQISYAAIRQANSFASQPHQTSESSILTHSPSVSGTNNLLANAEEGNLRRTVPTVSDQPQIINTYAIPTDWNNNPTNPSTSYSNPPPAKQFSTVDAAELEASLRILDSYTAPANPIHKQHITPIYNRSNMGRHFRQQSINNVSTTIEPKIASVPDEVTNDHINEALQRMLRPYLKGMNSTTVDRTVASTENTPNLNGMNATTVERTENTTPNDSALPQYRRISSSRNDLDERGGRGKTTHRRKGHRWTQSDARSDLELVEADALPQCQFDCRNNGRCVEYSKVCNGVNDCENFLDEQHCPNVNYQIRLSSNSSSHKGLLEIHVNSKWGQVCDTQFSQTEANVACKELGFSLGAVKFQSVVQSDLQAEIPYYQMDSVKCQGHETSLKECGHLGWGVHNNCSNDQSIELVCNDPSAVVMKCPSDYWLCETSFECIPYSFMCDGIPDCADSTDEDKERCTMSFRLADNSTICESVEGRVEVRNKGEWETVCSESFGELEAKVLCRSLGFDGISTIVKNKQSIWQDEEVPVWHNNIYCNGNEISLDTCHHNDLETEHCLRESHVHVKCSNGTSAKHSNCRPTANDLPGQTKFTLPHYCGIVQVADDNQVDPDDVNSRERPVYRVVAGKTAKRGHHPWQASIRIHGRNGGSSHECGAAIITAKHVVTAAHCFKFDDWSYYVRVGDHWIDRNDTMETEVRVKHVHKHKDFRKGRTSNHDIAIVELHEPLEFNEMVQPICLPSVGVSYDEGEECTISGWGSLSTSSSIPAKELISARVPIIADEVCRQDNVYGQSLSENMFCAGHLNGNSGDACGGDSGGPFACEKDGIHRLYGLISWGHRCGEKNRPGVYVKLANYIEWIKCTINNPKAKCECYSWDRCEPVDQA